MSPDLSSLVSGKGKGRVSIQWIELHRTRVYPPVDRLPTPTRAIELVEGQRAGIRSVDLGEGTQHPAQYGRREPEMSRRDSRVSRCHLVESRMRGIPGRHFP